MTDWAKKAVARLKEEQRIQYEKNKRFNEEQELKRNEAPVLWEALQKWLRENAASLNQEMKRPTMQVENMGSDRERIFCISTGLYLNAVFDSERLVLSWNISNREGAQPKSGNVTVGISNERVTFVDNDLPRDVAFIGEQMLDGLLNH